MAVSIATGVGLIGIVFWAVVAFLDGPTGHRAEVELHCARKRFELEQHRFQVRRDAERVRREIENELQ